MTAAFMLNFGSAEIPDELRVDVKVDQDEQPGLFISIGNSDYVELLEIFAEDPLEVAAFFEDVEEAKKKWEAIT